MTAALISTNGQSALDAVPPRPIPAWKRLGLKLKFANEYPDQPTQLRGNTSTSNKRRHSKEAETMPQEALSEHDLKKRSQLHLLDAKPTKRHRIDPKALSPSLKKDSNGIRKTVSFTSDTKIEDGDSSKSLILNWEAQYDQPSLANLPEDHRSSQKRDSPSTKSKSPSSKNKPLAALEYLTQFGHSRETWKFNKKKEVWILRNLFAIKHISSDYDVDLAHYLQGLKSASARLRIRQEAEEIIRKDHQLELEYTVPSESGGGARKVGGLPDEMEDSERRRAYYEDSVRRYKRRLEQHLDEVAEEEVDWVSPDRLAKRRRAEITLWAIGVTPSSAESSQTSDATISEPSASGSDGSAIAVGSRMKTFQKKRKNRTSVVELSSSSSSSDSNSSDSSRQSDSTEDQEEGPDESVSDTRSMSASSEAMRARTQSSASMRTQEVSSSDEDTGSTTSSSSGGPGGFDSDPKTAANKKGGRPRSVISVSS